MKNAQAWGWLTAGVLALGLNGIYHDSGAASWAHRAVDGAIARMEQRTGPVLALATGRAESFLSHTSDGFAQRRVVSCDWNPKIAQYQARAARLQGAYARFESIAARGEAEVARKQAQMARVESSEARMEARLERVRLNPINVDVEIPEVPEIHVHVPRVSIPDMSATRCSW